MQKALKNLSGLLFFLAAFCMSGMALADTDTSTPTWTPTITDTFTASPTSITSPTRTRTKTTTKTVTLTVTKTVTKTVTLTPTYSSTASPTLTVTKTPRPVTSTNTPTPPNDTATITETFTVTRTASPTRSPTPNNTATVTGTPRSTATASPTALAATSTPTVGTVIAPNQASALPRVRTDTNEQIFSSRHVDANGNTAPSGKANDLIHISVDNGNLSLTITAATLQNIVNAGTDDSDQVQKITALPAGGGFALSVSDTRTAEILQEMADSVSPTAMLNIQSLLDGILDKPSADMSSVTITGWGGTVLAPAFGAFSDGAANDAKMAGVNAVLMAQFPADSYSYAITMHNGNIDGVYTNSVDTGISFIGNTAIANQDNAPGWMPNAMGDGYGLPLTSWGFSDDRGLLTVNGGLGADLAGPNIATIDTPSAILDPMNAGNITAQAVVAFNADGFGSPLTSRLNVGGQQCLDVETIGLTADTSNGYTLTIDTPANITTTANAANIVAQAVVVSGGTIASPSYSFTDTYTDNADGVQHTLDVQNYTWQIRSDDPVSIGLAVTAKLQISIDAGATWADLETKTVADILAAPTTITGKPGDIYRVNITNLVLGATATNVAATVKSSK